MRPEKVHKLCQLKEQVKAVSHAISTFESEARLEATHQHLAREERFNRVWDLIRPELLTDRIFDDGIDLEGSTAIREISVDEANKSYGVQFELSADSRDREISGYWYDLSLGKADDSCEVLVDHLRESQLSDPIAFSIPSLCSLETSLYAFLQADNKGEETSEEIGIEIAEINFESLQSGDVIILSTHRGSLYRLTVKEIKSKVLAKVERISEHDVKTDAETAWALVDENTLFALRGSCSKFRAYAFLGEYFTDPSEGHFIVGQRAWLDTEIEGTNKTLVTSILNSMGLIRSED